MSLKDKINITIGFVMKKYTEIKYPVGKKKSIFTSSQSKQIFLVICIGMQPEIIFRVQIWRTRPLGLVSEILYLLFQFFYQILAGGLVDLLSPDLMMMMMMIDDVD
jgi:hypothetical protein